MTRPDPKELGQRIKTLREQYGWTQDDLARRIHGTTINGNMVSRWECGRHAPSAENLAALALALGVTRAQLTGIPEPVADVGAALARIETQLRRIADTLQTLVDRGGRSS